MQWDPNLLFLLFSALDCQQSLWAGFLSQRGGAAALEQRQHWLHLAWGPLHLRRLLGKREHSPGRTRVAAVGGRHVRGVMPLQRLHAGWTHVCSQDFHFLSPKGCGGDDDGIKQRQNMAQQMHFLLISALESPGWQWSCQGCCGVPRCVAYPVMVTCISH